MKIDIKWALNLSVVNPKAENIGWWNAVESDPNWWTLYLWIRRN